MERLAVRGLVVQPLFHATVGGATVVSCDGWWCNRCFMRRLVLEPLLVQRLFHATVGGGTVGGSRVGGGMVGGATVVSCNGR